MGTSILALLTLISGLAVALTSLVGIGLLAIPAWLVLLRGVADLERQRLTSLGHDIIFPYGAPAPRRIKDGLETIRTDIATQRDLIWLPIHATWGLITSAFGVQAGANVLRDLSSPLWWNLLPPEDATALNGLIPISTWWGVAFTMAMGAVWLAICLFLNPVIVRGTAFPGVKYLTPHPDTDLTSRIAELTATRAAALEAHSVELRRIERALHDGAQNRLVGVAMLTGAAQRSIHRDPDSAQAIMSQAHNAAEQALAELRTVVRGILPPILENRGLNGALHSLATECAVECTVNVDVPVRCPVSIESTIYFTAAEALTNVSKHSGANQAALTVHRIGPTVSVVVQDDGHGGATVASGSGLSGIFQRVAAHDGTADILSPPGGPTTLKVELPCGS